VVKTLWRLLGYWRPYWLVVILSVGSVLVTLSFSLAQPAAIQYAIDTGIAGGDVNALLLSAGLILLFQTGRGFGTYGQVYLGEWLSQYACYDLRNALFSRIQSLSFAFHDTSQTGQLMSRATADVEGARSFLDVGLTRMVLFAGQFIGVSVLMLLLNWQLAVLIIVTLPIVIRISLSTTKMLRPIQLAVQQHTGQYAAVLQECLIGIRVVKAFTAESREFERFKAANWAVREKSLEAASISANRTPMLMFTLDLLNVAILAYGGWLVLGNHISIGTLFAFAAYRQQLVTPVQQIGNRLANISRAAASAERIFEVLDASSEVVDKPDASELGAVKGHVRYEDVSFGYGKGYQVIQKINIDAQPGQTIALVGAVGSGKTTVVHLLPRFYDLTSGRITIDGQDIRDVTLSSLRANLGIVMQDAFLFNASMRDNIAYGKSDATEDQIVAAAKVARLHDFIMGLPDAYDSWVGERGITLSGGQRQRLAIARTILLDPRILILDDSTSSVDMETEYLIQQAMGELLSNRTAFVIAHRLQTVRNADVILVLQEGKIVEQGDHDTLLAKAGLYSEIYDAQLRDQEETAAAGVAL
jgi:ABC-type multidrug transport system fused ATPase/permease subunit